MNRSLPVLLGALFLLAIALAACSPPGKEQLARSATASDPTPATPSSPTPARTPTDAATEASPSPAPLLDYEIVTLLPRDAIPAVFDPEFLTVDEAGQEYDDDELVLGVEINGEARAYSIPHLSSREIVNDTVGGRPIAATW